MIRARLILAIAVLAFLYATLGRIVFAVTPTTLLRDDVPVSQKCATTWVVKPQGIAYVSGCGPIFSTNFGG